MLTVTLIAYACSTAAMDDCEMYAQAQYQGTDAMIRCELQRQRDLAMMPATTLIDLSCEAGEEL